MDKPISSIRVDYVLREFDESQADRDPLRQFDCWFDDAVKSNLREPNAMTLATVGPDGGPAARIVLLRGYDARGFCFYTNYASRKGRDLQASPRAALCFWWAELERQVRIEGVVSLMDAAESDAYFASRPRESQLGAWASIQSDVIPDRNFLEEKLSAARRQFPEGAPPRPENWGGYRLAPTCFEFWQGRPSRLHDRLQYQRVPGGGWAMQRLSP